LRLKLTTLLATLARPLRATAGGVVACCLLAATADAQVVMDRSFGRTGGPIPKVLDNYGVTADLGKTVGNNLFHSFSQFDVAQGETATFSGPKNIQNILTRVTGGNASSIDGTIRSTIGGANLFLMNPHGVIFGQNAQLDVSGSFVATTADYIKLADGARFVAALDADDSVLSTAPIASFGFLGNNPGSIAVRQGSLATPTGNLSMIGGDIDIDGGTLQAPGGRVEMVSVRSKGEVPADGVDALGRDDFKAAFPEQGDVTIENGAQVDVSGDRAGHVVIRSGTFKLENARIEATGLGAEDGQGIDIAVANGLAVVNGGRIDTATLDAGAGGDIKLSAGSMRLDGQGAGIDDTDGHPATRISTSTLASLEGAKAGDIVIKANSVDVANTAEISSTTLGPSPAGHIEIDASNELAVVNGGQINTANLDAGAGGDITLTAGSMRLDGQGAVDESGLPTTKITTQTFIEGPTPKAGDIVIKAGSVDITNSAQISSDTLGSGSAGRIEIDASSVRLDGANANFTQIESQTIAEGNAGDIILNADSVDIRNTAQIVSSTLAAGDAGVISITTNTLTMSDTALAPPTSGSGKGGSVDITAGSVVLDHSIFQAVSTSDVAGGGNIRLTVGSLDLTNQSVMSATAFGQSSGGNITVVAASQIRVINSTIAAEATQDGGNISVEGPMLVYLLDGGKISASAGNNGGNISVGPGEFIVLNNGTIDADAVQGMGGQLNVVSNFLFTSPGTPDKSIHADSQFGTPGTVVIQATQVDLSGVLLALPTSLLGAESQLREWCGLRLPPGGISSFVALGRGGAPVQPDGPLPSLGPVRPNPDAMPDAM